MKLDKHLPSHMVIAGNRVIVSYEGQPVSCYVCGGTGHMRQTCLYRSSEEQASPPASDNSWAKVVATGKPTHKKRAEGNGETNSQVQRAPRHNSNQGKSWPHLTGMLPDQSMWDLLWTTLNLEQAVLQIVQFSPESTILPMPHTHSSITNTT
jgi:hypothetical protein